MYQRMLKMDGDFVLLVLPAAASTPTVDLTSLMNLSRHKIYGSQIGDIRETQEMLDYSIAHNIYPRVEIIPVQQLDQACQKVLAGELRYRYVLEMKALK